MRISIRALRSLIREEIGRNYHSLETNPPFSFENVPGINVEIYPAEQGQTYYASVTVEDDDSLSSPLRTFLDEEEARMFARNYVEDIQRMLMSRNL
jgi:hypothetical protein|tara:strand:+ start:225 stop:512 length:288 start_codon:yes stop_codon:yes gene_type:complete